MGGVQSTYLHCKGVKAFFPEGTFEEPSIDTVDSLGYGFCHGTCTFDHGSAKVQIAVDWSAMTILELARAMLASVPALTDDAERVNSIRLIDQYECTLTQCKQIKDLLDVDRLDYNFDVDRDSLVKEQAELCATLDEHAASALVSVRGYVRSYHPSLDEMMEPIEMLQNEVDFLRPTIQRKRRALADKLYREKVRARDLQLANEREANEREANEREANEREAGLS
jgi:hypothetical protein